MASIRQSSDDKHITERVASPSGDSGAVKTGSLEYIAEQGGNGSLPTYQEASGAPIEAQSPLGYKVKWYTIIFLNIGQMIGTGVFSTREFSNLFFLVLLSCFQLSSVMWRDNKLIEMYTCSCILTGPFHMPPFNDEFTLPFCFLHALSSSVCGLK